MERVGEIQNELLMALEKGDSLDLDLSGVTRSDVSFQQIICSAHRSFAARSKPIRLRGEPSQAVLDTLQKGGFGQVCIFSLQDCLFKGVGSDE